jgi:hypothetical protein
METEKHKQQKYRNDINIFLDVTKFGRWETKSLEEPVLSSDRKFFYPEDRSNRFL